MKLRLLFLILSLALLVQPSFGWMMFSAADPPDSGILSNSFVDILYQDYVVWLAGGAGLSKTEDFGGSWVTFGTASGLVANEPSAIYGRPGQIWIAGSHTERFDGINFPFGDGFSISYDNGLTWETSIPEDSAGASFAQLVYDITGTDSSTYAAAFHGGLIVTHDFGQSWGHLFFSPADSSDWNADNWADLTSGRYYACAADTFHLDTTIIWAGTAAGVQKFYYLPKRVKLGGNMIYDMAGEGDVVFLAHEGGITRTDSSFSNWFTVDTIDGLGSNTVKKLTLFNGRLLAGVFDPDNDYGLGLYESSDLAESWTKITTSLFFDGEGAGMFDFKIMDDTVLYIAAGDSGAVRTVDLGQTWERFFVDSADTDQASPRNQVYSLDLTGDSLYLGTRAGMVLASYLDPFEIDFDTLITFPEHDSSGSFVSLVRHFDNDSISFTWAGVEPQTPDGNYAAWYLDSIGSLISVWGDSTTRINEIEVTDSISVLATAAGLFGSQNKHVPPQVVFGVADMNTGLTLIRADFLTVGFIGNRLYTGSSDGFAYRISNDHWPVYRANTNPKKHDLAVLRTHGNSGLPGDWVVALEVQNYDTDTLIWAACRRVTDTTDTIAQFNAVAFTTDFGDNWQSGLDNFQIWNFTFDDEGTVYAAASEGLYYASPPWTDWTRADIIDPTTGDTIVEETQIYSVEVVEEIDGTYLWVGTGLGLAKRNIDPDSSWEITRIFKSTESSDDVFAAPVPYSPINNEGRLSIHYRVETSADITVEIYDFAMNLVAVPAENRSRAGGSDYYETWDGFNESGDMVATGMYFFKVSYSTGEELWGRLAIVP